MKLCLSQAYAARSGQCEKFAVSAVQADASQRDRKKEMNWPCRLSGNPIHTGCEGPAGRDSLGCMRYSDNFQ